VLHAETPDGRAVVIPDFLFLGIEAHALADDGGWAAVRAPYGEGEFEADGENALGELVGALAERVRGGVEARGVGGVGRIVPAHIEALHLWRMGGEVGRVVRWR